MKECWIFRSQKIFKIVKSFMDDPVNWSLRRKLNIKWTFWQIRSRYLDLNSLSSNIRSLKDKIFGRLVVASNFYCLRIITFKKYSEKISRQNLSKYFFNLSMIHSSVCNYLLSLREKLICEITDQQNDLFRFITLNQSLNVASHEV